MARIIILIGLVIAIVCCGGTFVPSLAIGVVLASRGEVDVAIRQQALATTIQIVLLAPVLDDKGQPIIITNGNEQQMQYRSGEGLGTVVNANNELLIVTHDHWTLLSPQLAKARFYNVDNELLVEMSGSEFLGLIRSRDGGTMVLAASAELFASGLLKAAEIGDSDAVGWGETVTVVYRQPETDGLDVKVMAIRSTSEYQGSASYVLQSKEGTVVVPGNSGGGIWHGGKLVGNMWTTMVQESLEDGSSEAMNLCRAALLFHRS